MKKIFSILGISLLGFIVVNATLSLTSSEIKKYTDNGYVLSDNFTSFNECDTTKEKYNTEYASYKRSDCFSDGVGYKYFICQQSDSCNLNITNNVQIGNDEIMHSKVPYQDKLDKFITNLKAKKEKYSNYSDYIAYLDKLLTTLNTLGTKYKSNSNIVSMIDYLKDGINQIKESDDIDTFLCEFTGNCSNTDTINGECGDNAGKTLDNKPTTGLCSKGTATTIIEEGNSYKWTCKGNDSGKDKSCFANKTTITKLTQTQVNTLVNDITKKYGGTNHTAYKEIAKLVNDYKLKGYTGFNQQVATSLGVTVNDVDTYVGSIYGEGYPTTYTQAKINEIVNESISRNGGSNDKVYRELAAMVLNDERTGNVIGLRQQIATALGVTVADVNNYINSYTTYTQADVDGTRDYIVKKHGGMNDGAFLEMTVNVIGYEKLAEGARGLRQQVATSLKVSLADVNNYINSVAPTKVQKTYKQNDVNAYVDDIIKRNGGELNPIVYRQIAVSVIGFETLGTTGLRQQVATKLGVTVADVDMYINFLIGKSFTSYTDAVINNDVQGKSYEELKKMILYHEGLRDIGVRQQVANAKGITLTELNSLINGGSSVTPPNDDGSCGNTVSAGGYTYTTKLGLDGKCWTAQNMKHNATITFEGEAYYNYSTATDNTKVCGALGNGWHLPSKEEYQALINAGGTGWTGNKLSGVISKLSNYYNSINIYDPQSVNGYRSTGNPGHPNIYTGNWWVSTSIDSQNAYQLTLYGWDNVPRLYEQYKFLGLSVICTKNP